MGETDPGRDRRNTGKINFMVYVKITCLKLEANLATSGKGSEVPGHPRKRTIKGAFHVLIAIFSWTLFVYCWFRVLPQIRSRDAVIALAFIGVSILATVIPTLLWVRYNIGIFRRKGPRRNPTLVTEERDTDVLGRRIGQTGPGSLKAARLVVVSVEGERKNYETAEG